MEELIAYLNANLATIPVTSIKKALPIDWSKMTVETIAHLVWHGTKQKANDPNGAKELTASEKEGNSLKVIDNLEKNELRDSSLREVDPFDAEVMRLAVVAISNKIIEKGGKLKDYKMSALRAKANEAMETYPDWKANILQTATDNLTKKAELASAVEIEL